MCEFDVTLKDEGESSKVTDGIVYAKAEKGSIVLRNILGQEVRVDESAIEEVDVDAEKLVLIRSPLISSVRDFLETYRRSRPDRHSLGEVEAKWEKVKALGNEAVTRLKEG